MKSARHATAFSLSMRGQLWRAALPNELTSRSTKEGAYALRIKGDRAPYSRKFLPCLASRAFRSRTAQPVGSMRMFIVHKPRISASSFSAVPWTMGGSLQNSGMSPRVLKTCSHNLQGVETYEQYYGSDEKRVQILFHFTNCIRFYYRISGGDEFPFLSGIFYHEPGGHARIFRAAPVGFSILRSCDYDAHLG